MFIAPKERWQSRKAEAVHPRWFGGGDVLQLRTAGIMGERLEAGKYHARHVAYTLGLVHLNSLVPAPRGRNDF